MARPTMGLLVAGVVALLMSAGCGSGEPPTATSGSGSGSGSGTATAKATGSASATPSPSSVATPRAKAATTKALLPAAAFAKIGLKVDDKPRTTRWDWFDTCRPTLPSESRRSSVPTARGHGRGSS